MLKTLLIACKRGLLLLALLAHANCACLAVDPFTAFPAEMEASGLDESRFTKLYADALIRSTGAKVTIIKPLELSVVHKNGFKGTTFLQNAWASCKNQAGSRRSLIRNCLQSEIAISKRESQDKGDSKHKSDRSTIVPLVKNQEYLLAIAKQSKNTPGVIVSEPLGADLYVVYAEDLPSGMQLLSEKSLKSFGVTKAELRSLANDNLKRMLQGKVSIEDKQGIYVLKADGNYESSLLARPKFWDNESNRLHARIIMAVPARSVILYCKDGDQAGLERMRTAAGQIYQEWDHPISTSFYVWNDGHWQKR